MSLEKQNRSQNSRTLTSLLQPTTNQITPLAFTLENQNYSPLAPYTVETHLDY